jgi:hypothetical protein
VANVQRYVTGLFALAPFFAVLYLGETKKPGRVEQQEWRFENWGLLPVSLAFVVGVAFLAWVFVHWLRAGRRRNGMHVTYAISHLVIAVAVLGMGRTNDYSMGPKFEELAEDPSLYLIPIWLTLALAAVTVVYQLRSPRE